MRMRKKLTYLFLGLLFMLNTSVFAALPSAKDIQSQLEIMQKNNQTDDNKVDIKNLEDTLVLLEQLEKQKQDNENLTQEIQHSVQELKKSQQSIANLKAKQRSAEQIQKSLANLSIQQMKNNVDEINQNLQQNSNRFNRA